MPELVSSLGKVHTQQHTTQKPVIRGSGPKDDMITRALGIGSSHFIRLVNQVDTDFETIKELTM